MREQISEILVTYKVNFLNRFIGDGTIMAIHKIPGMQNNYCLDISKNCNGAEVVTGTLRKCNNRLDKYLKEYNLLAFWEDYKNNI